jgi:chloramphenicol-sensitive protein RarD
MRGDTAGGGKNSAQSAEFLGTVAAVASYVMWGLFPIYWKRLSGVEAFQVLSHRLLWAALFTLVILAATRRIGVLASLVREPRRLLAAAAAALFISINWGIYIWAVNSGHVIQAALGYYINPLFSVAFGAIFLHEKLDRYTVAAVGIAVCGVIAASIMLGSPPWIPLVLAISFASYGLVKKRAGLDPLAGLAAETLVLAPFALAYLAARHAAGEGVFGGADGGATLFLALAGPVTAIPLLTFAYATNRITLQRLGFIQYISPTTQLLLGLLLFRERLSLALLVAFATVIAALLLYTTTRFLGQKTVTSVP